MEGSGRPEGNETERFMALYSGHQRRLYLYAVALLCGAADAEDVLQEASLVLWQKFGQYQEGTNFFAWACRTVRNKAMEYCRNRRKGGRAVRLLDPDVLDHWADLAAEEIDRFGDSYRGILIDCMERLDPADHELGAAALCGGHAGPGDGRRVGPLAQRRFAIAGPSPAVAVRLHQQQTRRRRPRGDRVMTCDQDRRSEARQIIDRVLDGLHNDDDASRLNEILRSDPEISRYCMSYVELHGHLAWGDGIKIGGASVITAVAEGTAGCEGADSERAAMNGESAVTTVSGRIIPPIRHSSFAIRNALCFGSVPLAYVAIVLVFGAGLLGAWAWNTSGVTSPRAAVDGTPGAVSAIADPARLGVARITAMAGCRWEDLGATAVSPDAILAGNQFALKSGILEISYKSGAAVILQGPTNYEVESEEGGFLSAGKLTASIRPRRTGVQGSGSANGPSAFVLRHADRHHRQRGGRDWRGGPTAADLARACFRRHGQTALQEPSTASAFASRNWPRASLPRWSSLGTNWWSGQSAAGTSPPHSPTASSGRRFRRSRFRSRCSRATRLKSIGSEIGQQRLAAVGDGNDIELSPVPTPKTRQPETTVRSTRRPWSRRVLAA